MHATSFLLALFLSASIAAPAPARTVEGPVRLGQTARVGGPRVTPLRVLEDSRCPMNARCIRAGTVVLRARVAGGRWSRVVDLTLGQSSRVADGALTLVAVTPDRVVGDRRPAQPLRFAFRFDGGL